MREPDCAKWMLEDLRVNFTISERDGKPGVQHLGIQVEDRAELEAFRGVTSELALLELTVRPLQLGRQDVADEYELLLSYFPNLELEPVTREILLEAAALRARYRLRSPDAILLATGIHCGATAALTNDDGWRVSAPSGIKTILLTELR